MLDVLVVPAPRALVLLLDLERELASDKTEASAHDIVEQLLGPGVRALDDVALHLPARKRYSIRPQQSRATLVPRVLVKISQALRIKRRNIAVHLWILNLQPEINNLLLEPQFLLRKLPLKRNVLPPQVAPLILTLMTSLVRVLERPDPGISNEVAEVPQAVLVALDVQLGQEGGGVGLTHVTAAAGEHVGEVNLDLGGGAQRFEDVVDVLGDWAVEARWWRALALDGGW